MFNSENSSDVDVSQRHMPHIDGQRGLLLGRMEELVNETMDLFHGALELHWNYQGPNFLALHSFLDRHYHALLENFDDIAERAVTMGGKVKLHHGRRSSSSKKAEPSEAVEMSVDHYLTRAEKFAQKLRDLTKAAAECDEVSHDMLISFSSRFEKDMWQLRSTLGGASERTVSKSDMM